MSLPLHTDKSASLLYALPCGALWGNPPVTRITQTKYFVTHVHDTAGCDLFCLQSSSGVPSESIPRAEGESSVEVEAQPQIPLKGSVVSGEESDDGRQQEAVDLPATPWHPKPLGVSAEIVVRCKSSMIILRNAGNL